jgi:hypothetical protein
MLFTLKRHGTFRKADESLVCSERNFTVPSNLHYYVAKTTATSESSIDE